MIVSFYLNILLLNKLRILLKGKHYYMRSLGATAVGEITYTIITNIITYYGVLSWQSTANVIISDYFFKLIYSAIIAYPAALLVVYVKIKYRLDSKQIDFNPFTKKSVKVVEFSNYTQQKRVNIIGQPRD
ncbi:MAG: hypothetical protein A3F46_01350 [Legionellales bacterium RIFCSPHIGHO2_12_FULL_42_9]|nr:MAG: hypothetical protein A3F46_01350 [Legionellales bacterium RIFCSPHIGHO2_12_FULL_42_9]